MKMNFERVIVTNNPATAMSVIAVMRIIQRLFTFITFPFLKLFDLNLSACKGRHSETKKFY